MDPGTDEVACLRTRVAELESRPCGPVADVQVSDLQTLMPLGQPICDALGMLVDMMPVGLAICNTAGRIVLMNAIGRRLLNGGPSGTIFEPQWQQTLLRPDGTMMQAEEVPLVQALQGQTVSNTEALVRHEDGSHSLLLVTTAPIRAADGVITGAIAGYQDISYRRHMEHDLRDSEARLRAILNTAVDGIITIDEHGIIESLNPAALRIFGYTSETLIGRNVDVLIPPGADREHHTKYIENYCATGKGRIIGIGREVVAQRKDGTLFPMDLAVSEVRLSDRRLFTGITRDITARKQAEEALRALTETLERRVSERTAELSEANRALQDSEERFRQIADAIPMVIWVGLPDLSKILYVNPAYERVWGRPVQSLYDDAMSAIDAVHPDDRDRVLNRFLESFSRGGPGPDSIEEEFRVVWPDGSMRVVIIGRAFPIRNAQGDVYRVSAMFEDITEQKRLQNEVLEVGESERRRIGRDLHDTLGQSLTGISFLSRVLAENMLAKGIPEAQDAAEIGKHVIEAINMTRTLSHGLLPVAMSADGLMNALHTFAQRANQMMGIRCRFHADMPVLIHDAAFATHLYHIAQEATNNAVKHGRATTVDIYLSAEGERVTLRIENDGEGLPADLSQAKGMGLRIMEYRTRMIGGQIEIRREKDGKTVVECIFRQAAAPEP